MNRFARAIAAVCLGMALSGAHAATINLTGVVAGGTENIGGTVVTLTAAPVGAVRAASNITGAPGYSLLTHSAVSGFFTFCVELTQAFVTGSNSGYSIVDPGVLGGYGTGLTNGWGVSPANTVAISQQIDRVMSLGLSNATLILDLEALQLALWETIYDFGNINLSSGNFQTTGSTYVLSQAAFYAGATGAATAHYFVATDASHQDVLVVPEPASMGLVATALAGLALTRRQRPAA